MSYICTIYVLCTEGYCLKIFRVSNHSVIYILFIPYPLSFSNSSKRNSKRFYAYFALLPAKLKYLLSLGKNFVYEHVKKSRCFWSIRWKKFKEKFSTVIFAPWFCVLNKSIWKSLHLMWSHKRKVGQELNPVGCKQVF